MAIRELTVQMEVLTCECGIIYAVPAEWVRQRREDHKTFHCPNGCRRWFPYKTEEELLAEKNAQLTRQVQEGMQSFAEVQEEAVLNLRRFNGLKGYVEKLKRR